ncbi:MAG TPA: universal stress protein [Gemmatimonadaceae bacterium]|nr:universal stress protein [Gemmatimonadaceae bacterium]
MTAEELRFERILLASCRGADLAPAARLAVALAKRHAAKLHTAVAFEPEFPYPGGSAADSPEADTHWVAPADEPVAGEQLRIAKRQLAAAEPGAATSSVSLEVGQEPLAITRAARRHAADLIVMPTTTGHTARSADHRPEIGVALFTTLPLLAVSGRGTSDLPRRLLFAAGLDESIVVAADVARALLPEPTHVHLVHVATGESLDDAPIHAHFDRIATALAAPPNSVIERCILRRRSRPEPWRALLAFARLRGVELVVAGLHGGSLAERSFLRNTALRLLGDARVSTLVVPVTSAREAEPAVGA